MYLQTTLSNWPHESAPWVLSQIQRLRTQRVVPCAVAKIQRLGIFAARYRDVMRRQLTRKLICEQIRSRLDGLFHFVHQVDRRTETTLRVEFLRSYFFLCESPSWSHRTLSQIVLSHPFRCGIILSQKCNLTMVFLSRQSLNCFSQQSSASR